MKFLSKFPAIGRTETKEYSLDVGGKELKVKINELAGRANGAVIAQLGETVVLATCVMTKMAREDVNYLPLSVEYEERLYAAGKIKGSRFVKREGRPSDEAILTGRLIDRALRPRFNQRIRNAIQIIVTVLSYDGENDADIAALNAASLALLISDIPWNGPIAGIRINSLNNQLIINPTTEQREQSDLEVVAAGIEGKINMIEAKAKEATEEKLLQAIELTKTYFQQIIGWQKEIQQVVGLKKVEVFSEEPELKLVSTAKDFLKDRLEKAIYVSKLESRIEKLDGLKEDLVNHLIETGKFKDDNQKLAKEAEIVFEEEIDRLLHENIFKFDKRPDGRKLDEIRPINCRVGLLPRTHGSGLFTRGNTQAISVVTLGSPGKKQLLETMEIEGEKHFMHHYNFPPFCVGETGPLRGPGRREIGHGTLAEKALEAIIPTKESFPYTIRVVSEILSSNGSSSMASVCASSLALMDAGVPVKKAAAGIALGLVLDEKSKNYKILTDIQGPEDHHGDMDLKLAGTADGITAIQMDVKVEGLTAEILKDAFEQAKKARLEILAEMNGVILKPRKELSPYAPIILTLQINPERIRDVIGPGGRVINQIIEETGVEIDIEDSGLIFVTSQKKEAAEKAISWMKNLTHEVKVGEIFQGHITRIFDFGAMVEILPGQEGLIHISELAPYRVRKVSDVVKIGDIIPVKVKNIDELGRVNLSLKDIKKNDSL